MSCLHPVATEIGHAQGKTVRVSQVDVLVPAGDAPERLRVDRDEPHEPRFGGVIGQVAPEFDAEAVREAQLPREPRGEDHAVQRAAQRPEQFGVAAIAARDLALGVRGTGEYRQRGLGLPGKTFAVRVHQPDVPPPRQRDVLLELHFNAVGPHATHVGAPHPRELLQPVADDAQVDREEVAGDAAAGRAFEFIAGRVRQLPENRHLAQREQRRIEQGLRPRKAERHDRQRDEAIGRHVEEPGVIPHGRPPAL